MKYILIILCLVFVSCEKDNAVSSDPKTKLNLEGRYRLSSGKIQKIMILSSTELRSENENGIGIYNGKYNQDKTYFSGNFTYGSDRSTISIQLDETRNKISWNESMSIVINGKRYSQSSSGSAIREK